MVLTSILIKRMVKCHVKKSKMYFLKKQCHNPKWRNYNFGVLLQYLNYFTGGKINYEQDRIHNLSFGDGMRVQERLCIS